MYQMNLYLGHLFDIKYLFNSNILFNYAYKPDYGQIEQHPAELNFTNYEIYPLSFCSVVYHGPNNYWGNASISISENYTYI